MTGREWMKMAQFGMHYGMGADAILENAQREEPKEEVDDSNCITVQNLNREVRTEEVELDVPFFNELNLGVEDYVAHFCKERGYPDYCIVSTVPNSGSLSNHVTLLVEIASCLV